MDNPLHSNPQAEYDDDYDFLYQTTVPLAAILLKMTISIYQLMMMTMTQSVSHTNDGGSHNPLPDTSRCTSAAAFIWI